MVRRVLGWIGISLVIGVCILLYSTFNGNIFLKLLAKNQVIKYLEDRYEKEPFIVQEGTYNFKDDMYVFKVEQTDEKQQYAISMSPLGKRYFDGVRYSRLDIESMNAINEEGSKLLTDAFKDEMKELIEVNIYMEFVKGEVVAGTRFSPEFTKVFPFQAMFVIDAAKLTKNEFQEICKRIQRRTIQEGYVFQEITVEGIVESGTIIMGQEVEHGYQRYTGKVENEGDKIVVEQIINIKQE